MTNYTPPRHKNIPNSDLAYAIQNNWPVLIVGDLNARHSMFGYKGRSNPRGRQMYNHIYNDKLNYIGPGFPTFFSHNNRKGTKPDVVLTNNKFYFNYHVKPSGMGLSDHMGISLRVSCKPILVECPIWENYENTKWGLYADTLKDIPLINLEGKYLKDIEHEIDTIYTKMYRAKDISTPKLKFRRVRTSYSSIKFRRLTEILDYYSKMLLTTGMTPYVERKLNETRNALVDEGNAMKFLWWEEQLCKVEAAAKDNRKFWRTIKRIQGKPTNHISILKASVNNNEIIAEEQSDKIKLLTNIWSNVYKISPLENQHFCHLNEKKV